jgi:integrase
MGRVGLGIEARKSSIRLHFVFEGKPVSERLTINRKSVLPTPAHMKFAMQVATHLRKRIAQGTFDYAEFFPDSPRAQIKAPNSFGPLADLWLESKGQLEAATKDQYMNAVAFWKRLLGEQTPIDKLTFQVLSAKIGKQPWASGKSANNYLIALRGIFAFEYSGRRTADNPMAGIKNLAVVKKLPDPLTADERDRILADMTNRYDERVVAYFIFAFFTGMRPEEMIALKWCDIDFTAKVARVRRVRTFRGSERDGSKTHAERDVDLVSKAMAALATMKKYTFLKRTEAGEPVDVFENPVTCQPWHDERSQRDHYWTPTLKRLGIRHRRAYNTRHTYATTALMAGVKPPYIANQLGHANTKMLFEKYARWIEAADKGQERHALEAAMGQNSSQILPADSSVKNQKAG